MITFDELGNRILKANFGTDTEAKAAAYNCVKVFDKLMNMKRKSGNTEYNKALDDMYEILSEVEG